GSGALLFVVLFSYFFLSGRTLTARLFGTSSPVAVASRPTGLILTPPPALPTVEPLILEDKAPVGSAVETKIPAQRESQAEKATKKPAAVRSKPAAGSAAPAAARKAKVPAQKAEAPKVAATPELSEEVRRDFNLALFYQEEKNFPQARRAYEKVVQMWPLFAEAHNNLGVVYKELGMHDAAMAELKKAVALSPRYTMAFHNLGVIHQLKGEWKQAIKNYERALAVDRNYLSSYNNLGLVYRSQNQPHEAREILEKALAINPAFAQTHYNLALVLEGIGEPERARFHFQKFVDLSGEENQALVERVRAHLRELVAKR
ncbi:MAG: tetratricopeptide repeat protein, partial [Deltaproteobacteria bacterium]|nr:tetratricopeptide repeat protein [Deltaproteobacteria bacterium]